jgi:hypothetical protein
LLYSYSLLSSYPGSAAIYNTDGKENAEELGELGELGELEEDVKGTYIWLSCTLAVVTSSAVKGTVRWPAVVDVICSLYPKTHPFV